MMMWSSLIPYFGGFFFLSYYLTTIVPHWILQSAIFKSESKYNAGITYCITDSYVFCANKQCFIVSVLFFFF